jgi:hypothetical protein
MGVSSSFPPYRVLQHGVMQHSGSTACITPYVRAPKTLPWYITYRKLLGLIRLLLLLAARKSRKQDCDVFTHMVNLKWIALFGVAYMVPVGNIHGPAALL